MVSDQGALLFHLLVQEKEKLWLFLYLVQLVQCYEFVSVIKRAYYKNCDVNFVVCVTSFDSAVDFFTSGLVVVLLVGPIK